MAVNMDKPGLWANDTAKSVDFYNNWFLTFAPKTFRDERIKASESVERMLGRTDNFRNIRPAELRDHPQILFALRMATAPPIARDRLVGLAGVSKSLVNTMEKDGVIPPRMAKATVDSELAKIASFILRMADVDIFPWLAQNRQPTEPEIHRAATIIADRLCGANADPIIRNAQESRQLLEIKLWLEARGYKNASGKSSLAAMTPGTFAFRMPILGQMEGGETVNIPVDAVVMPLKAKRNELPLMIEAKSAGDFTNVNKRRKEEASKVQQLRRQHGPGIRYILFLCGYFDSVYLRYEASELIDWVWEHRVDDLAQFGL